MNEPTILLKQIHGAEAILDIKQPEKIITLGGDCSSSQVPFDYLHGKYGDSVDIIWMVHILIFLLQKNCIMSIQWFWAIY